MYAKRGAACWRNALATLAKADGEEIVARLAEARSNLSRHTSCAELRSAIDEAYLYACARLWWERAEKRTGAATRDGLDAAAEAWRKVCEEVRDRAWYRLRYRMAAYLLESLGLPLACGFLAAEPVDTCYDKTEAKTETH
jgi:hypothetical protein